MTTTYAQNIINCYNEATPEEVKEGLHWYDNARNIAFDIAGGDISKGAGVLSAFSPLTPWYRTLELASDSLRIGTARTDTLGNSSRAAQRIIDGEHPLEVLKGLKTRAFYSAIADPNTELVTIDTHAYSIAIGYKITAAQAGKKIPIRLYRTLSHAYIEAAHILDMSPIDVQAITWVHWRNVHVRKQYRKGEYAS